MVHSSTQQLNHPLLRGRHTVQPYTSSGIIDAPAGLRKLGSLTDLRVLIAIGTSVAPIIDRATQRGFSGAFRALTGGDRVQPNRCRPTSLTRCLSLALGFQVMGESC